MEVACKIKEAINEAVEKNDANTGSLRKIMYSVGNQILKKHQASNPWLDCNNLNYFRCMKTKVISTTTKVPRSTIKLSSTTVLSDLTGESQGSQECSSQDLNNSASAELSSLSNNLIEHETEIIEKNKEDFNNCLKMTAGVAFRVGELNLSNGNILKRVKEQHKARVEKQLASKRRKTEENDKLHEKVEQVHSKSNNPQL